MKRCILGCVVTVAMILSVSAAHAVVALPEASFTITPENELKTTVGETVSFDLDLTVQSGSFAYNMWDFDFTYDSSELAFTGATYGQGMNEFDTVNDGAGNLRLAASLPFGNPDLQADAGQTYDVASLSFLADNLILDGLPDISLLSQEGTSGQSLRGFSTFDPMTFEPIINQFSGAEGPDVSAVPVPGALWLLGSGLIGLAGLRRRR